MHRSLLSNNVSRGAGPTSVFDRVDDGTPTPSWGKRSGRFVFTQSGSDLLERHGEIIAPIATDVL